MRKKLQPLLELPPTFLNHYALQPTCKIFEGMLLSTRGISSHPPLLQNFPQLSICTMSCIVSLRKASYNGPSQFAIANGLHMGILPKKFHSLTKTELAMTTLVQNSVWLFVVKSG
jgi:hypothetical protein